MQSRILRLIAASVLLCSLLAVPVFADFGPKDSLIVYVQNPPPEPYYLDLLTQEPGKNENLTAQEKALLDQKMLALLYSCEEEGWFPALTEGTNIPMFGKLVGTEENGRMVHQFGYFGLPNRYRIILVTKSGAVSVSPPYTRKTLQSSISFDYASSRAVQDENSSSGLSSDRYSVMTGTVPGLLFSYLLQFLSTFLPTLLLEGFLLFLFGFPFRENWKVFLLTNLLTQLFLTLTLGSVLIFHGSLSAQFSQLPCELLILAAETLVYLKFLKGQNKARRCVYAITANLASWLAGFLLLSVQYRMITPLL